MGLYSQVDETQELETCVLCWKLTDVRKDTPIYRRICYVEGGGQLHPRCYEEVYPEETKRRVETEARHYFEEMGIIFNRVD